MIILKLCFGGGEFSISSFSWHKAKPEWNWNNSQLSVVQPLRFCKSTSVQYISVEKLFSGQQKKTFFTSVTHWDSSCQAHQVSCRAVIKYWNTRSSHVNTKQKWYIQSCNCTTCDTPHGQNQEISRIRITIGIHNWLQVLVLGDDIGYLTHSKISVFVLLDSNNEREKSHAC